MSNALILTAFEEIYFIRTFDNIMKTTSRLRFLDECVKAFLNHVRVVEGCCSLKC